VSMTGPANRHERSRHDKASFHLGRLFQERRVSPPPPAHEGYGDGIPGMRALRPSSLLPPLVPRRVLLVEDNQIDVALVRALLADATGSACQLTAVSLLADARSHLLSTETDCVLLDLSLPDADGLETVEGLLDIAPQVPIVVLSGLQDDRVTAAALNEGAQDYLIKGQVDGGLLWRSIRYAVERKRAELELRHQALHDPLTGLANRALSMDRLNVAISRLRRAGGALALLLVDLDRFKWVNDSLGHDAGDELLMATARRIELAVRPADLVARLGGDEFLVMCEELEGESTALTIAERVQESLTADFLIAGSNLRASASVGFVTTRDPTVEAEELLRDADIAMHRAKELGKGRCEPFDMTIRKAIRDRLRAEQDLRRAVAEDELVVFYQPVVDLATGHPVGAEALIRWRRPDGEIVPPGAFIDLAEETGIIVPIGDLVLRRGCEQLAQWNRALPPGEPPLTLNVNLSARQLTDPGLVGRVQRILAATGADPAHLCLELTETAFLVDEEASLGRLKALKGLGVALCIDDFGTGYSSLSHLTRFPVDVVKIDRSFTEGLDLRERDTAVVEAVVALGQALGLVVVAEGVETEAQAQRLRALGCPQAQGYLFGRPAPASPLPAATEVWSGVA
jgi:diguanylate cyclase (GGDEF)-like protein